MRTASDPSRPEPPLSCFVCGYDMSALPIGTRCPECGEPEPVPANCPRCRTRREGGRPIEVCELCGWPDGSNASSGRALARMGMLLGALGLLPCCPPMSLLLAVAAVWLGVAALVGGQRVDAQPGTRARGWLALGLGLASGAVGVLLLL